MEGHEQNLFHLLEAPRMLYIRLMIWVTDVEHMMQIQKNLPANVMLVRYEFPDGSIKGSNIMYDK